MSDERLVFTPSRSIHLRAATWQALLSIDDLAMVASTYAAVAAAGELSDDTVAAAVATAVATAEAKAAAMETAKTEAAKEEAEAKAGGA